MGKKLIGPRREVARGDELYPKSLLDLDPLTSGSAPERLFVIGNPSVLALPSLAFVGARRATPSGRRSAAELAEAADSEHPRCPICGA